MSNFAYKIRKISKMNPIVVIKKLLSFDEVFVTGYRKRGETLIPMSHGGTFAPVPNNKRYWYADPIIFKKNGRNYLFMEAFDKKAQKGKVAYCELTAHGPSEPKVIIDEPFHMSFPTVFEMDGEVYMIPETSSDRSFRVYHATDFPEKWETVARFETNRLYVDTTVLESHENGFSILSCEVSPYREYECRFQKFTFKRDASGKFTISEDSDFNFSQEYDLQSRNGGALFEYNGKRYVAAQESTSSEYGLYMNYYAYTDNLKKIAAVPDFRLSVKDFSVKGYPRGYGVHSYCFNEDYEIVDLKYMEFTPKKMIQRLTRRHS